MAGLLYAIGGLVISGILIYAILRIGNMAKATRWILAGLVGLLMFLPSLYYLITQLIRIF
jgi:hypothetical protein